MGEQRNKRTTVIAEVDPTMQVHLRRIKNAEAHGHYIGHRIQNENMNIMASEVKGNIIDKIKLAKCFPVILDYTPDVSHKELMSLILSFFGPGNFFQCLGRTPFASLLAALMVIIGTCVFCGTSFQALQLIIVGVFNNLFRFNLNWLEVLQVLFVVIGVVMGLFAIILLIFGFLATGSTRNNIYSGPKCIMGGRITAALFMLISYVLTLGWLALMAVGMVSVTVYASVDSICTNEIYGKRAEELVTYCFNLTRFGVYREEQNSDSVCDYANLRALCNKVTEAGPLFCVAFGATVLVVVGMVHFLITLAANYTRIKISRELTEYRDAVEMEELELHSTEKKDPPPYRDASDS